MSNNTCYGKTYDNQGNLDPVCEILSVCERKDGICTDHIKLRPGGSGKEAHCYATKDSCNGGGSSTTSCDYEQQSGCYCCDDADFSGEYIPCGSSVNDQGCDLPCAEANVQTKCGAHKRHKRLHGGHFGQGSDKKKPSGGGQAGKGSSGSALSELNIGLGIGAVILGIILILFGTNNRSRIGMGSGVVVVVFGVLLLANVIKLGSSDSFTISHNCCM